MDNNSSFAQPSNQFNSQSINQSSSQGIDPAQGFSSNLGTSPASKTPETPKPKDHLRIVTIILIAVSILAIASITFNVISFINIGQKDTKIKEQSAKITDLEKEIEALISPVQAYENCLPGTNCVSATGYTTYAFDSGYVYVPEWGIKIKIPDNATDVSHTYIANKEYPYIYISAGEKDGEDLPDSLFLSAMGILIRVPKDSTILPDTTKEIGTEDIVYEDENYKYVYVRPDSLVTSNPSEQKLETHLIDDIVQPMLRDGVSAI